MVQFVLSLCVVIVCSSSPPPPQGRRQHTKSSNFPKNYMKFRKFRTIGGRAPPAPPKSATACGCFPANNCIYYNWLYISGYRVGVCVCLWPHVDISLLVIVHYSWLYIPGYRVGVGTRLRPHVDVSLG